MASSQTGLPKRALPAIDRDNAAFWTWGGEGKLAIYRCAECSRYVHPPVPFCPTCESRDVAPQAVSGRGRIVTFTVNNKQWVPGLEEPFVLALVAIDEQDDVRIACNIVGCPPDRVDFDMPVEVTFEAVEELWVPLFRPVAAA